MIHNPDPLNIVLKELLERYTAEKQNPERFRLRMQAMGPEGGRFIETIVRAVKPRRGLEIGTSSGFSALCAFKGALAAGVDFHLVTVDFDSAKAEWAQNNFERAGVHQNITILVEDGLDAASKVSGPFDFVILDAAKSLNLPILKELLPKLNPGAVILTDNVLTHPEEMKEFIEFVRKDANLASGMVALGNGIEVTFKLAAPLGCG